MSRDTVRDLAAMLKQLSPQLDPDRYRYVQIVPSNAPQLLGAAIATFREDEGVSAIVPAAIADQADVDGPDMARITLGVYSDLEGVGLTAAVATCLADAGIACNMVAAMHHDHAFVPAARGEQALSLLRDLARSSA
ncbi:ACT domain-containing protein [Qipengyuania seohaensis]|uniref:ACT domain-containing protein n=1 Tax=Qipengyuania seohaensis TaxID=266951 RepID=UPI001E3E8431|nr:ACT domain-containing protein [Qipengyuania seohaensis]